MSRNRHNALSKKFKRHASPWGDKAPPEVQRLPVFDAKDLVRDLKGPVSSEEDIEQKLKDILHEKMAKALLEKSKKIEPRLKPAAATIIHMAQWLLLQEEIVDTNLSNKSFRMGKSKSLERTIKKARDEYDGEFTKIRDGARSTIEASTPDELAALCVAAEKAYEDQVELRGGVRVVDIDNRFRKPTGTRYRSFKMIVAIPMPDDPEDYCLGEIMITHGQFEKDIQAKRKTDLPNKVKVNEEFRKRHNWDDSHDVYELVRFIEEYYRKREMPYYVAKEYGKYVKRVERIHDTAAKKYGIFEAPDFARFERVWESSQRLKKYLETPEPTRA